MASRASCRCPTPSRRSSSTASTSCAAAPPSYSARHASANTSCWVTKSRWITWTRSSASSATQAAAADARENLFSFFSGRRINLRGTELDGVTLDPAKYGVDSTLLGTAFAPRAGDGATLILSYRQIDAILELQLYRLTQLSMDELFKELGTVRENIAEYESILASEKKLRKVIVAETHGNPRQVRRRAPHPDRR